MGSSQPQEYSSDSSSPHNWSAVIARARSGCQDSFELLSHGCRNYLMMAAREELGRDLQRLVAPSDLVQQTLLTAYTKFGKFSGHSTGELFSWLRTILANQAASNHRFYCQTQKRRASETSHGHSGVLDPRLETPSQIVMSDERRRRIWKAIEQLPEHYQTVLRMHFIDGMTFEAIGKQMDRSADATRKLWLNAVRSLKKLIPQDDDPGKHS